MNIDLGSLFFNASIETGGGTPSWGTALGQSAPDYKLTYPGASDILVAMDYCYSPLSNDVSCKLGKGGKEYKAIESQVDSKYEIIKAALFTDIQIKLENELIPVNTPFALIVTKENEHTHKGRRTLKYSDSIKIGEFCNKTFYDKAQEILGSDACWFAYAIDVVNQSQLIISIVKVSDSHVSYDSPESRKRAWTSLLPDSVQIPSKSHSFFFFNFSSNFNPSQIIYYGVPGCGKSHQVNKKIKSIPDYNRIRTVFHPEYTNADFIGQILPEVNVDANGRSIVEYKFNPGPFTEIVRRAYQNPDEEFFLVIEEINRGNAAAIFGDMFQLLDRLDADEKPEEVSSEHIYGAGWSSYGVDNPDVNAYIRNQLVIAPEKPEHCSKVNGSGEDANPRLYKSVDIESDNLNVTWREKNGNGFTPKPKHLHFSANTAIRLPPNLSIYATMNTSDQNVFTLDNAFQRRWDMELVPNTCNWDDEDHKKQAQSPIGDTDICWETFRDAVNSKISGGDFFNADDKQLGLFFIEADDEKIDQKKFANKVLKYLWADVFKRDTGKIFKSKNLSKVVEDFTGTDAFDKVFTDEFAQSLKDTNDATKNK